MESRANYAVVGAFATLVVAALVGFIYWFSAADSGGARTQYDVMFTGSVAGLSRGTQVLFNGIPVGDVTAVRVDPENPARVIARLSVLDDAPVMNDTRALLEIQGLTGMANVQLLGGTLEAGRIVTGADEDVPVLMGEPSDFQVIVEGARDIVVTAESTFGRIDTFLSANEDRVASTLANLETLSSSLVRLADTAGGDEDFQAIVSNARTAMETANSTFSRIDAFFDANETSLSASISNTEAFTGALASNADGLEDFLTSMSAVSEQVEPLAGELRNLTVDVRRVVEAIPPRQLRETFDNVGAFAETLANNTDNIEGLFLDARTLASNLADISDGLNQTLRLIDEATDAIDPQIIARALDNVEQFSTALGENAPAVEAILTNTETLTGSLLGAADRIDTITARLDAMMGSDEGTDFFGELALAATAIRNLAGQLDERSAEITTGINAFTSRGLGGYTALADEARGTLRRLDRILANFERNPQVLLFGGDSVRDFQRR
ncbi:MCE family protein [Pelagibacterium montanilacus]|uniref:MlaD family protein n=1 Tax=Pelagibacterium montanilacus TaxID=2185280 RepID=UPI000F8C629F|nr:MlaD family protein [Pelagibacterium montanilacus]